MKLRNNMELHDMLHSCVLMGCSNMEIYYTINNKQAFWDYNSKGRSCKVYSLIVCQDCNNMEQLYMYNMNVNRVVNKYKHS